MSITRSLKSLKMKDNNWKTYLLHLILFIITLGTTTLAGVEWIGILKESDTATLMQGFYYSIPFLGILTIHEFGHYITAKIYKVSVTLPYYLPFYLPGIPMFGTLGAFIRIKSILKSRKIVFDVGIAGPIAGFIAALGILFYGFTNLPEPEYIYKVHKEYENYGLNYSEKVYSYDYLRKEDSLHAIAEKVKFIPQENYTVFSTGKNLLFTFFGKFIAPDPAKVPNKFEMFHYPFLFAGFLSLFFTALNLIPLGQLDGGHILYALIGSKKQKIIAPYIFAFFVFLSCLGFLRESFGLHAMDNSNDMFQFAPLYLFFLYFIFSKVFENPLNNVMLAVIVFSLQFFTLTFFPNITGLEGWAFFALIIGRFIGIYHPPAIEDQPIDLKRKILGWFSFFIFIICFSPQPLIIETISK